MPGAAGEQQHRCGSQQRAGDRDHLRDRPPRALWPVEPQRRPSRSAEEREADEYVDVAAPERRRAEQRHQRRQIERGTQRINRRGDVEIDGNRQHPDDRDDHERPRHRPQTGPWSEPSRRSRDEDAKHEQADRAHHREEHHPPRDQQPQRGRRPGDARDRELRRGPRVRADRVGERALYRVTVDRDRSPIDQIPALRQTRTQRHDQRVRVRRRAVHRTRRLLPPGGVGDRDDREPRLDRLVIGQLHVRGRTVEHAARRRHRPDQIRVRRRSARYHDADGNRGCDRGDDPPPPAHASSRSPERRLTSANPPTASPRTPTISATIASPEDPPPPKDDFASIVGAGESDDSGPDQFTIDPSE